MNIKKLALVTIITVFLNITPAYSKGSMLDFEYMPKTGGFESAFGIGFYQVNENAFGFYGNIQGTIKKRDSMYDFLTVSSFGDPVTKRTKDILIGNIGITRGVIPHLGIYAGVGYASATGIAQKFDSSLILSPNGSYYVNDPANDKSGVNFNAGILLYVDSFLVNVGWHSFTKNAYVGFGVKF